MAENTKESKFLCGLLRQLFVAKREVITSWVCMGIARKDGGIVFTLVL